MADAAASGDSWPRDADQLPIADVLRPAIVAAVLVDVSQFLLDRIELLVQETVYERAARELTLGSFVDLAVDVVSTVGIVAALVYLILLGPTDRVLRTGVAVVYVASVFATVIQELFYGRLTLDLPLLLDPLVSVALFLGVGFALRWFVDDHPFAG